MRTPGVGGGGAATRGEPPAPLTRPSRPSRPRSELPPRAPSASLPSARRCPVAPGLRRPRPGPGVGAAVSPSPRPPPVPGLGLRGARPGGCRPGAAPAPPLSWRSLPARCLLAASLPALPSARRSGPGAGGAAPGRAVALSGRRCRPVGSAWGRRAAASGELQPLLPLVPG